MSRPKLAQWAADGFPPISNEMILDNVAELAKGYLALEDVIEDLASITGEEMPEITQEQKERVWDKLQASLDGVIPKDAKAPEMIPEAFTLTPRLRWWRNTNEFRDFKLQQALQGSRGTVLWEDVPFETNEFVFPDDLDVNPKETEQ